MANGALAFLNQFDAATLVASTAGASTPITNLQTPHIAVKWRNTGGGSDAIEMTWPSSITADTFALIGLGSTFLATGFVGLRLSSGTVPTAGDVLNLASAAGIVDPNYGYAVILTTPKTFRSARWDLTQAGATYIEAGRGFVGLRNLFTYNFQPGAQRTLDFGTKKRESYSGQTYVSRSTVKRRTEEFTLGTIPSAERWSVHEALDQAVGDFSDVLFIKDVASANLGRDTVWGLCENVSPVTQPITRPDIYSRSYRIKERG